MRLTLKVSSRGSASSPSGIAKKSLDLVASSSDEGFVSEVRSSLKLYLSRVESVGGRPRRLFPFTRNPSQSAPRTIAIDPRMRFGQPATANRGIPTDSIIDRYRGGDSVKFLAEDYDLTTEEIEEAIRYESLPLLHLSPFGGS